MNIQKYEQKYDIYTAYTILYYKGIFWKQSIVQFLKKPHFFHSFKKYD